MRIILLIRKCIGYIFSLLLCVTFISCEFLFTGIYIDEPESGSETTESKITVSGRCSGDINTSLLFVNGREIASKSAGYSFSFGSVGIESGHVSIEVEGYSEYDAYNTFITSNIDVLVMIDYFVKKV